MWKRLVRVPGSSNHHVSATSLRKSNHQWVLETNYHHFHTGGFRNFHAFSAILAKPNVPSEELNMPALSPSMETGKVAKWVKKEGDVIEQGDVIAEIETDKTTVPLEAGEKSFLAKILVQENGEGVRVGLPIAILVGDKKHVKLFKNYVPDVAEGEKPSTPAASSGANESAPPKTPSEPVPSLAMPALSPTMESGKIVKWVINEGEAVQQGEVIAEIETDKTTVSLEANENAFLAKILVPVGVPAIVGAPIAILVSKKEEIAKYKNYTAEMISPVSNASSGSSTPQSTPSSVPPPTSTPSPSAPVTPSTPTPSAPVTPSTPTPSAPVTPSGGRILASPLAKATASAKGIDLAALQGTGPNGRIIRADVEEYIKPVVQQTVTVSTPTTTTTAPPPATFTEYTDIPNSTIRKITAERLTYSKQNIPHYYLTVEIVVDKLMQLRSELNAGASDFKLSINDFVIKAAALALKAVPEVNSEWRGDVIRKYHNVHINVAVNTPRGLLTPIIRDVDKIGLKTINSEVKIKAGKANEGKISPDDLQQGTFTISNLGMFGITQFTAVISPPQSAILAVGTTKKVPVLIEDLETPKVKVTNVLTVTLSCDHRVIDGAVGAKWLEVFKDLLENPMKFLL